VGNLGRFLCWIRRKDDKGDWRGEMSGLRCYRVGSVVNVLDLRCVDGKRFRWG
jgi:hypothetical protein